MSATQQQLVSLELGLSGVQGTCTPAQPTGARQVGAECGNTAFSPSCSGTVIYGCTNPSSPNYNALATQDDGTCQPPGSFVLGCMDSAALNWNPLATVDDGSCQYPPYPKQGCTDPAATNYDPTAIVNDGSCAYAPGAFLRIWNMYADYGGEIITVSGIDGDWLPYTASPSSYTMGYQPVSPGSYNPQCIGDAFLQSIPITLEAGKYYTLFMRRAFGGGQEVFLVDDNWSEGDVPRMRVYELRANVQATGNYTGYDDSDPDNPVAGTIVNIPTLLDGQNVELSGIDASPSGANFSALDIPTGQTLLWNTAVDFTINRLATTLMINDPYGRWRPRIVFDGPDLN